MRKQIVIFLLAVGFVWMNSAAASLTPDEVRGGWIADLDGHRHVLLLNVRGTVMKGVYCWDCSNPQNLAFVLDGKLETDSFSLVLLHDVGPGSPFRENVKGKIVDGRLQISAQRQNSNTPAKQATFMREPR